MRHLIPTWHCCLTAIFIAGCASSDPESEVFRAEEVMPGEPLADIGIVEALRQVQRAHIANPRMIPTASDAHEANAVRHYITSQYDFPASVYYKPHPMHTTLTVYGVVGPDEQSLIVRLLESEMPTRSWKPIILVFKRAEVWSETRTDDGGVLRVRGAEETLRSAVLGHH